MHLAARDSKEARLAQSSFTLHFCHQFRVHLKCTGIVLSSAHIFVKITCLVFSFENKSETKREKGYLTVFSFIVVPSRFL